MSTRTVEVFECTRCRNKNVGADLRDDSGGHGRYVENITFGEKQGSDAKVSTSVEHDTCSGPMEKRSYVIEGECKPRTFAKFLEESPVVHARTTDDGTIVLVQRDGLGWAIEGGTFRVLAEGSDK